MIDGNPPTAMFAGDMVGGHPSVQSFSAGAADGHPMEILHDTVMNVQPQISEPLPLDSGSGLQSKFGGVKPSGILVTCIILRLRKEKQKSKTV